MFRAFSPLSLALLMVPAVPAWAVGADEWQLALGAGGSLIEVDDEARLGVALAAEAIRGLDDQWALRAGLGHSLADVDGRPEGLAHASTVSAGVRYGLDVLRVLPYARLGVLASLLHGATVDRRLDLGIELGLGADYLLNPRWAIGAAVLGRWLPIGLSGGEGLRSTPPHALAVQLELSRFFD